jgi:hypothetical protein
MAAVQWVVFSRDAQMSGAPAKERPWTRSRMSDPLFAIGSVFGGTVAFTIGAIAGLLYGVVEMLLLGACGRLYRWTTSNPT